MERRAQSSMDVIGLSVEIPFRIVFFFIFICTLYVVLYMSTLLMLDDSRGLL